MLRRGTLLLLATAWLGVSVNAAPPTATTPAAKSQQGGAAKPSTTDTQPQGGGTGTADSQDRIISLLTEILDSVQGDQNDETKQLIAHLAAILMILSLLTAG